jgi:hypothetical protein
VECCGRESSYAIPASPAMAEGLAHHGRASPVYGSQRGPGDRSTRWARRSDQEPSQARCLWRAPNAGRRSQSSLASLRLSLRISPCIAWRPTNTTRHRSTARRASTAPQGWRDPIAGAVPSSRSARLKARRMKGSRIRETGRPPIWRPTIGHPQRQQQPDRPSVPYKAASFEICLSTRPLISRIVYRSV